MLIYNTLSGQKENLEKASINKKIRLFVCGPTVYDYAHIGNARTYIAFDIIVRWLRKSGWKVYYLQNITDIDDKIIRRAAEENISPETLARKYEKIYLSDMKTLGIKSVTKYARATDHIRQIIRQIQALIKNGNAYEISGDGIYFDISTFASYGKLSRRTTEQAEDSISRIDESVNKKNKGDFALWKLTRSEKPAWDSPWGPGRPGWHIEDTAITEHYFGSQYEVHGGAVDLKFPHHEAEIAQQESASGKSPLAKIWMHTGFLLVGGKKMAKSAGNFITVRDFLKKYPVSISRYLVAVHHYRSPMDYSDKLAQQAESAIDNLSQFVAKLSLVYRDGRQETQVKEDLRKAGESFETAMNDDFNTPEALAAIFILVNEFQKNFWDLGKAGAKKVKKFIKERLNDLGIELFLPKVPFKIKQIAKKRELFRVNKQFVQSDNLRKEIERLGYGVEDTPAGPFLWPKGKD
ncbi:MAG: cysteine--tRNA ligase [Candidatus Harrisonbacteria bacterium]|nr:cysteine--tRNA ligase [Candidatus Harrisonbacteria bacterium]